MAGNGGGNGAVTLRHFGLVEQLCRLVLDHAGDAGRQTVAALTSALAQDTGALPRDFWRAAEREPVAVASDRMDATYAAQRLARLLDPRLPREAWSIADMHEAGRIGDKEFRAAVLIRWAAEVGFAVPVPAVNPARVIVDGGPGWRLDPETPWNGDVVEVRRWLTEREPVQVRGRKGRTTTLAICGRIVVWGDAPRALDRAIGLRNGRSAEITIAELQRYVRLNDTHSFAEVTASKMFS